MKVLGMMTGTSMDGLDCCYANIKMDKNLKLNFQLIDFKMYKFPKQIVDLIIDSIGDNNKEVVAKAHEQLGIVGHEPHELGRRENDHHGAR